jgi:hypothetical protein
VKKQLLLEMEGASQTPRAAPSQCVHSFPSGYLVFTWISRVYACALIVRSRAVDPRRTADMIEEEEKARQHFEGLKLTLSAVSLRSWKKHFKYHVDEFIKERVSEKDLVSEKEYLFGIPCEDEEEEDRVYLHRLRRLVAGATQEWELVQQPQYAAACAALDGALVWQGRGYVSPTLHAIPLLQPSLQS